MDDELRELASGPLHRFPELTTLGGVIPQTGAGVYTIWDDADELVYVGIAGRNPTGTGLATRLRSHASGRRSGNQFCVYVADHYVMPELTREQIVAMRDGELSMNDLIRNQIHSSFGFRFAIAETYATLCPSKTASNMAPSAGHHA